MLKSSITIRKKICYRYVLVILSVLLALLWGRNRVIYAQKLMPNTERDGWSDLNTSQLNMFQDDPPIPFLTAPFYGTRVISSGFDHSLPDYGRNQIITFYDGDTGSANCTTNDQCNSCTYTDNNTGAEVSLCFWSDVEQVYFSYDGHDGIDYKMHYAPVLAAAEGAVTYAGWAVPGQHTGWAAGLGLHIQINHPDQNGYGTSYGHLSTLFVQTDAEVTISQEIGISGDT